MFFYVPLHFTRILRSQFDSLPLTSLAHQTFRETIAPAPYAEGFELVAEDDFAIIGRALLFLQPLSHLLSVQEQLLIMDAHGNSSGKLAVRVCPFQGRMEGDDILKGLVRRSASARSGGGEPAAAGAAEEEEVVKIGDVEIDFDEIEEAENLMGQELGIMIDVRQARQLPVTRCARVFVRYRWFSEDALTGDEEAPQFESEPFAKQTTNPELAYRVTHMNRVTPTCVRFFNCVRRRSSAVPPVPPPPVPPAPPSSASSLRAFSAAALAQLPAGEARRSLACLHSLRRSFPSLPATLSGSRRRF